MGVQIEHVQTTKKKRKIVRNVDHESEKKKIAEIIKETERMNKRILKEEGIKKKKKQKKMIEIDLKQLAADKAKVFDMLSLPQMPSILSGKPPTKQQTPKGNKVKGANKKKEK